MSRWSTRGKACGFFGSIVPKIHRIHRQLLLQTDHWPVKGARRRTSATTEHRARWARCSREAGRSSVGNELPVPPHQRCGPNEEGGPTLARKESRDPRQHDTIGRGEARSRHLRTEHRELVTKDRDLDVLLIWRRSDPNEVEQLSNEKEGHRTAHADDPGTFAASLVRAAFLRLQCAGINRHGEGDENALRRRSSDPRWPRVMR